jgi:uncharacterized membrane protein (UPF0136 family)
MKLLSILFVSYALIVGAGGIFGWVKAGSLISLCAGVGSGILLLGLSHFIYRKKKWALISAGVLLFLLTLMFALRFIKTGNFLPGGLLVLLGIPLLVMTAFNRGKDKG